MLHYIRLAKFKPVFSCSYQSPSGLSITEMSPSDEIVTREQTYLYIADGTVSYEKLHLQESRR